MSALCEFEKTSEGWACQICGYVYPREPRGALRKLCRAKREIDNVGPGLGDHVTMLLESFGLTEPRVAWFLKAAKLIEADATCGCDERRKRLNALGWRLVAWAKRKGVPHRH